VAEHSEFQAQAWLKGFLLTWFGRFSIFLAHHVTRPLIPLYLITFGASCTVIGRVHDHRPRDAYSGRSCGSTASAANRFFTMVSLFLPQEISDTSGHPHCS